MKTLIGTIFCTLLLLGCSSEKTADQQTIDKPANSLAADQELFTKAAANLVEQFGRALQSTLLNALNENGTAYAVQVCQLKAQEIVMAHTAGAWSVKRVSEKWRNINDRPDTAEVRILKAFEHPESSEDVTVGSLDEDSNRVFHYYKKIVTRQMCLQCHGDLQTVDLDLWKEIRIAYPYDKATGYQEGDVRGMFVVSAKWPEGREMAQLLAEGAKITDLIAMDSTATDTLAGDTVADTVASSL